MPKVEYRSNAKPSVYAPPPLLEEKKREEKERVTAAVLSITAKAKRREAAPLQEHSIGQYSCHDCCSEKEEERARLG